MAKQPQVYREVIRNIELQEQLEKQEEQCADLTAQLIQERTKNFQLQAQANQLRIRVAELETKSEPVKDKTVGWLPIKHLNDTTRKESIDRDTYDSLEKRIFELNRLLINQEQQRKSLQERLVRAEAQLDAASVAPPPCPAPISTDGVLKSREYIELEDNYQKLQEQYEAIIEDLNEQLANSKRKLQVATFRMEQMEQERMQLGSELKASEFHMIG